MILCRFVCAGALRTGTAPVSADSYKALLVECKAELAAFITKMNANPIMVRLAWHDSGTYDKAIKEWPAAG